VPHQETPRLFDLVRVQNNDYRVAFYSQLRNTLVTREIELATQIAYGE
jgi:structural maintenance of chromosome 4